MLYHIYLKTSPTGTISGIQVLNAESAPNTNETVNVVMNVVSYSLEDIPNWRNQWNSSIECRISS